MALRPIPPGERASAEEKDAYRQALEHARQHPERWANERQPTPAMPREQAPAPRK